MTRFDTIRRFETPEGGMLALRPAGPVVRAAAWLIDLAIRAVVFWVISLLFSILGELGIGVILVILFLLEWFYNVVFEVSRGTTPGKKRMGLQVVQDNGAPITWSSSLLRNLLRVVDFMPLGYGLGLLWMLFSRDFKRLGDIAAGTMVVYATRPRSNVSIPAGVAIAPPIELTYAEQQSLVTFAERCDSLSSARQAELAGILQPLHGSKDEAAVSTVLGYANHVTGKS